MILEKRIEGHAIMSEQSQQQFDSSLKDLVQEEAAEIIPHFLEGAQFIDTLNATGNEWYRGTAEVSFSSSAVVYA